MLYIIVSAICLFIWVYSLPLLVLFAIIGSPVAITLLFVADIASYFLNIMYKTPVTTSSLRTLFNSIPFYQWFESISEVNIPTDKHYLICSHPHGILCLGPLLTVHFKKKSRTLFAVAPIVFKIPVIGWICGELGCIPCDKVSIKRALKVSSVILVPGGVPEIVMYERDELFTMRRGMFTFGVPIIPLVTLSKHYYLPKSPLYDLRVYIARKFNVPITFPYLFGWNNTWLPKRNKLEVKMLNQMETNDSKIYFTMLKSQL